MTQIHQCAWEQDLAFQGHSCKSSLFAFSLAIALMLMACEQSLSTSDSDNSQASSETEQVVGETDGVVTQISGTLIGGKATTLQVSEGELAGFALDVAEALPPGQSLRITVIMLQGEDGHLSLKIKGNVALNNPVALTLPSVMTKPFEPLVKGELAIELKKDGASTGVDLLYDNFQVLHESVVMMLEDWGTVTVKGNGNLVSLTDPALDTIINADNLTSFVVSGACKSSKPITISGSVDTSVPCVEGAWMASLDLSNTPDGAVVVTASHAPAQGVTVSYRKDASRPTTVLSTDVGQSISLSPVPVALTFSEAVSGLAATDITVVNGTVSSLSGEDASYVIEVTPTAAGIVKVSVGENVAFDAAGNPNESSNVAQWSYATLTALVVTPGTSTVAKGLPVALSATGHYDDGSTKDLSATVNWSSSDDSLVTIDEAGQATALNVGTASITASLGGMSASATLSVSAPTLVTLALSPANPTIAKGLTQAFTLTGTYSDGSTNYLTTSATWKASDTSIAKKVSTGGYRGENMGSATITASVDGKSAQATLTVTAPVLTSLDVTPSPALVVVGSSVGLTAKATYSDGTTTNVSGSSTWSSADAATAIVNSSSGVVSGVLVGDVSITASYGGQNATATVNVVTLQSISVSPTSPSVAHTLTLQLAATATYSNAATVDVTTSVTWTSADTNKATVDEQGLVSGIATGSTTITANLNGITDSQTLTITPFCAGAHLTTMYGSGTVDDPYRICTMTQLGNIYFSGSTKVYRLATDLDGAGVDFQPIAIFSGTFDGAGHTLDNLTINKGGSSDVGLFSRVSSGAVIKNLTLTNVSVIGASYLGALVGSGPVSISNVSVDGTISGGSYVGGLLGSSKSSGTASISNSTVSGTVSATGGFVGGLAGSMSGNVTASSSSAAVSQGSGTGPAGGLIGFYGSYGTSVLSRCASTGSISSSVIGGTMGGLVGQAYSHSTTIKESMAAVDISALDYAAVGGLVGRLSGKILDSYAVGKTTSGYRSYAGGIAGIGDGGSIANVYATTQITCTASCKGGGLVGYVESGDSITINDSVWAGAISLPEASGVSAIAIGEHLGWGSVTNIHYFGAEGENCYSGPSPTTSGCTGHDAVEYFYDLTHAPMADAWSTSVWKVASPAGFPLLSWE